MRFEIVNQLRPLRRAHLAVLGLAGLLASLLAPPGHAQVTSAEEDALKAAFVYNFMTFTEWPVAAFATDQAPFVLCVAGTTSLGQAFDALAGKAIRGRPIAVQRIASLETARQCQVLYLENVDTRTAGFLASSLGGASVLTVSDSEEFALNGGIITLLKNNNRIAFEINVDAAARAGLKLSSKLLSLAKIVRR
jgi:hypothetical protein